MASRMKPTKVTPDMQARIDAGTQTIRPDNQPTPEQNAQANNNASQLANSQFAQAHGTSQHITFNQDGTVKVDVVGDGINHSSILSRNEYDALQSARTGSAGGVLSPEAQNALTSLQAVEQQHLDQQKIQANLKANQITAQTKQQQDQINAQEPGSQQALSQFQNR